MATLFALGYASCRGVAEFTELLAGNHIDLLVDVRFSPFSRNPLWRSVETTKLTVLRSGLVDVYIHEKGLGNPDYKSSKPATRVHDISRLEPVLAALRSGQSVGLMCYCPTTAKCHRRLLVQAVLEQMPDVEVVELERSEDPR